LFFKKYAFLGIFRNKFLLKNVLNNKIKCVDSPPRPAPRGVWPHLLPPATTLAITAEFYFNRVSTGKVYIG